MTNRSLLRGQIAEAWRLSITADYAAQRINSERSLQASVWSNLNALLPAATRRMFIEPSMVVSGPTKVVRYPDLVICNTREVIGIIELKYQPRLKPSWRKDLATFQWIAENKSRISISNARFRGVVTDTRTYPLAQNILFVWAGVHVACDVRLTDHLPPDLAVSLLALHAETRHSKEPHLR